MSSPESPVSDILIVDTIEQARSCTARWRRDGKTIAFVPTMGNLHVGHLALVKAANELADHTVVSIFVNPLQFGKNEDFGEYPRTFDEDIRHLSKYDVDMVFAPGTEVIYPDNGKTTSVVDVPGYSSMLEGEQRPVFFRGVTTVVNKLFNIIQPDIAVFGEKDYQQLLVIRQMVSDLAMPVEIHAVPTVREKDGLAMSSRNHYLDDEQRQQAVGLHDCLVQLVTIVKKGEQPNYEVGHAGQHLDQLGFIVDYIVIRRQQDLAVPEVGDRLLIALAAARLGTIRLLDNIPFELSD